MKKGQQQQKQLIPGGKLLACYVAHAIALDARRHWEKLKTKADAQRELVRSGKVIFGDDGNVVVRACYECGFVGMKTAMIKCASTTHDKRFFCADCLPGGGGGFCRECSVPCGHRDGCNRRIRKFIVGCGECKTKLCDDHKEFCRHCAVRLCYDSMECAAKHACARGKKRAKIDQSK